MKEQMWPDQALKCHKAFGFSSEMGVIADS